MRLGFVQRRRLLFGANTTGYWVDNAASVTIRLPANRAVGDVIQISA